ncbi:MAG: gephyrin-like molybdotransferase Glp, partial [Limisphaerales bacterium]
STGEACGRITAEPCAAQTDLPPFDNSAMDGYAVVSADVKQASAEQPVSLKVIGEVPAGTRFDGKIEVGECTRIFTGSPVPAGADAVVMQEDTMREGDTVQILDSARPFEHVRLCGEDIKTGQSLVAAGQRITPGMVNLLLASGCGELAVAKQPVIGLLATGDELRTAGQSLETGQIYESNRHMLAAQVEHAGCLPRVYDLVPDQLEATRKALENAFAECDAIITSGGVSVGDHDFVKQALTDIGGELDFWRVRVKPGKPFVHGKLGSKNLFGLPGNPVSAFVTFMVLVRPALLTLQGATNTALPTHPARLADTLPNRGDRRHFMRVHVNPEGKASSAGAQASHMLHSLAAANALVDVPPATTLEAGREVLVQRFDF